MNDIQKYDFLLNKKIDVKNILDETTITLQNKTKIIDSYKLINKGNINTKLLYENDSFIKIILCTCIYKRPILTRYCLEKWLNSSIFKIVIIYSLDEDYDNLKDLLTDRVIIKKYDNFPLSNKWNYSVKTAENLNPDAIMILGSDDIFLNEYVTKAQYFINRGIDYISASKWIDCCFYANKILLAETRYIKRTTIDGIGAGRIYSNNLLKKINYELYNFEKPLDKCLDGNSFKKVSKYIKNIRYNIVNNSIILLKNPDETIAITINNSFIEYLHSSYRTNKIDRTIDEIKIFDYH